MIKSFSFVVLLLLMSCGVSPDDEYGLYYKGDNPLTLVKGDTSKALEFKRIGIVGPQGKMKTDDNYKNVKLSHIHTKDADKVKILNLKLLALDTTSNSGIVIKAVDMASQNIEDDNKESNYITRLHVKVELP